MHCRCRLPGVVIATISRIEISELESGYCPGVKFGPAKVRFITPTIYENEANKSLAHIAEVFSEASTGPGSSGASLLVARDRRRPDQSEIVWRAASTTDALDNW